MKKILLVIFIVSFTAASVFCGEFEDTLKKAEQGHAEAQNDLGLMYANGEGVPQKYEEAAFWFKQAAEKGDAVAQGNLGTMYYNGWGVPQDYEQAVYWDKKAAEQGDVNAQFRLGLLYYEGESVVQDYKQAVYWYTKASEQGHAEAQNNLGVIYSNGEGVAQDHKLAVKCYRKAAEQGNPVAQFNLGEAYENSWGVAQNFKLAVDWYTKSAEQGNVFAQGKLEILTGSDKDSQHEQQAYKGATAAILVIIGFIVILCIYTQKKDSAGAERESQKMKRFEITYKMNENAQEPVSIGTVANNEKKALKAFSLKVPGIPKDQIIAVNGQAVKEEWLSAYPKNIPKKPSELMTCPYCLAKNNVVKISKRAERCPKCNNTILKECMVCGCKVRVDSKNGCPKCGDPEPFSEPEGSAFGKNSRELLKVCPSCGCSISERAPQCPDCHTPTIVLCKICGKKISCWSQTCPECGDPEPFSKEIFKEDQITKRKAPSWGNQKDQAENISESLIVKPQPNNSPSIQTKKKAPYPWGTVFLWTGVFFIAAFVGVRPPPESSDTAAIVFKFFFALGTAILFGVIIGIVKFFWRPKSNQMDLNQPQDQKDDSA